jgi:hypothetical protein
MKSSCCGKTLKPIHDFYYCEGCLKPVKVKNNRFLKIFFPMTVATVLIFLSLTVIAPGTFTHKPKQKLPDDITLNDSTILSYMSEIGILFPEIVIAQIHLESNNFKSKICRLNHNLLGIKYIKQKEAIGEQFGHALYPTFKSCLRDYKRLQKYYLGNLQKKYAEDSSYSEKLVSIK